jgi:hypothetical protein
VSTRKPVNREVYEGADVLSLRLRAAKKPAVIPFLEIPPEEIDLEPMTIEPVNLIDAEPVPIMPLVVPMDEILPFDDVEESPPPSGAVKPPAVEPPPVPIIDPTPTDGTPADRIPAGGTILQGREGLSFFGTGVIDGKRRSKSV